MNCLLPFYEKDALNWDMLLRTLGKLELVGDDFQQEKLFLLVAYLALEGPTSRRKVAELFWRDVPTRAKKQRKPKKTTQENEEPNYMNNLAKALSILRPIGIVGLHPEGLCATVECDAAMVLEHLRLGRLKEAAEQYSGVFAEGIATKEIGPALEEWLEDTRKSLASQVSQAMLTLAEREAAKGSFVQAGADAVKVYREFGEAFLDEQGFYRVHRLLLAAESPLCEIVESKAKEEHGISLEPSVEAARRKLLQQRIWIGRSKELRALEDLKESEWAWVRGVGKSALLQELQSRMRGKWLYLQARPYSLHLPMLQNLLGIAEGGEEAVYQGLLRRDYLLIDDWDQLDLDTQRVLERLNKSGFKKRMVLTGEGKPPLAVEQIIELGSFSKDDLIGFSDVFRLTQGDPIAAIAMIQGIPPDVALEARLAKRSATEQQVYLALALLDEPKLHLVEKALSLEPPTVSQAFTALIGAGLIEPSGQVRGRKAAFEYLQKHFEILRERSVALAHELPPEAAIRLYRMANGLIEPQDISKVQAAYLAYAKELIRRGFPKQAADELEDAPAGEKIALLRARALGQVGEYKKAIDILDPLAETEQQQALKGFLYWNLGEFDLAKVCAERALEGDFEDRAEAYNTLGIVQNWYGKSPKARKSLRKTHEFFYKAQESFHKALFYWNALGDELGRLRTLGNLAVVRLNLGEPVEEVFDEVLREAGGNPTMQAQILINKGLALKRANRFAEAIEVYKQAEKLAEYVGDRASLALAKNNQGVIYHLEENRASAAEQYQAALRISREIGDRRVIGMALANYSELNGDIVGWKEAIRILLEAGYRDLAGRHQEDLDQFMLSSRG